MAKINGCRVVSILILAMSRYAIGQDVVDDTASAAMTWSQVVDGEEQAWPLETGAHNAAADEAVTELLLWYRERGYYEAAVDSIAVDSVEGTVWVDPGDQVTVGRVILTGSRLFSPRELLADFETRPGTVLDQVTLERDIDRLLSRYDRNGYVLASAQIVRLAPSEAEPTRLEVAVHIDEGPQLPLKSIELVGAVRTKSSFISRVAGVRVGRPLTGFKPEDIADRLEATGLFTQVDSIRLAVDETESAILKIALQEEPPGAFDALVGYLPNAGQSGGGAVVGDVNILLRHVLGGGRAFGFRFQRNPGSVTRVHVLAEDPFIFGLPLRLAGRFDGFQQDSTFDTRSHGLEGGYRIQRLELFTNASRELTRPGSAQSSSVPSSDSWFVGVGFSYRRLDYRPSPRKGMEVESNVENGRKERETTRPKPDGGVERLIETAYQQRLRARGRLYIPVRRRSVAVVGIDTRAIQSDRYDEADLIRFGGANSMRGYNEDQFRGNLTVRLLSEWRYLIERTSFLFAFIDLGYVNIPEVNTLNRAERVAEEWLTGYGFGLQLETDAGLFSMSLALNGDEGLDAKVHVGMTLGL